MPNNRSRNSNNKVLKLIEKGTEMDRINDDYSSLLLLATSSIVLVIVFENVDVLEISCFVCNVFHVINETKLVNMRDEKPFLWLLKKSYVEISKNLI